MKSSRDKSQRRWTLMFIGDHGKVIELRHIRWLIGGTMVVMVGAILAAAVLFGVNQKLAYTNRKLRRSLETSQADMKKVRQQTDLLMAQLALAEVKAKDAGRQASKSEAESREAIVEPPQTVSPEPPASAPPPTVAGNPPEPTPAVKPLAEAKPAETKPAEPEQAETKPAKPKKVESATPTMTAAEAPQDPVMVEIDNLQLTRPAGTGVLNLEFKLRNVSPRPQLIEGRVVAILKGDDLSPTEWVTFPRVKLVDGSPSEKNGYRFAINNWRTMRLKTNFSGPLERYNLVEIYVFSSEGEVWLREAQPVTPQ